MADSSADTEIVSLGPNKIRSPLKGLTEVVIIRELELFKAPFYFISYLCQLVQVQMMKVNCYASVQHLMAQ